MATETYELCLDTVEVASYRSTCLHFSGVGVASNDTLAAGESLIAGWVATIQAAFLATVHPELYLVQLRARRATPTPSAVAFKKYAIGGTVGTRGTVGVGQQTCPSVFMVPTMGVKSGGRIFWPTIPAGDIVQNVPTSAWKAVVATTMIAMKTGFTNAGITWTLGIFSRKHLTTSAVTNYYVSPLIGFQSRRRRPGGAV